MKNITSVTCHALLLQQTRTLLPHLFISISKHGGIFLSGHWWQRSSWPTPSDYDHHIFWHHGTSQLLGPSQEQLEEEHYDTTNTYYFLLDNLSALISPGHWLELKNFEDKTHCNVVIYDLALTNHKLQFEETNDFIMHTVACHSKTIIIILKHGRICFPCQA